MGWNKLLNSKKGGIISLLAISIILLPIILFFWIKIPSEGTICIVGLIISGLVFLGLFLHALFFYISIKNVLKTKYGNYLLIETEKHLANEEVYKISYKIFSNKLFLYRKVSDRVIEIYLNDDNVVEKIIKISNKILDQKFKSSHSIKEHQSKVIEWDGYLDEVARREGKIDDVLK